MICRKLDILYVFMLYTVLFPGTLCICPLCEILVKLQESGPLVGLAVQVKKLGAPVGGFLILLVFRKDIIGPRPMQILPDVHAHQNKLNSQVEHTF